MYSRRVQIRRAAVIRKPRTLSRRATRENARIVSGITPEDRRSRVCVRRGSLHASRARTRTLVHYVGFACPEASCICVRVSFGTLSAVARGPFCCPLCEEHRFDTCRVADIKARPRAGMPRPVFMGISHENPRRDCARDLHRRRRPIRARKSRGTNVGRAREVLTSSTLQRTIIL